MQPTDLSFEWDIKSLFRESDREAMLSDFDLWSHEDVKANADAILDVLEGGSMPCDGAWPGGQVETFRRWAEAGTPP